MRKILVLINPGAGSGKGVLARRKLEEALKRDNALRESVIHIGYTTPGGWDKEVDSYLNSAETVAVCGGDGTVHRIINMLVKKSINKRIGLYPMGTGNDLAINLGCKQDDFISFIKRMINGGTVKKLDIFSLNKKVFFTNYAGFGYDGYLVGMYDSLTKSLRETALSGLPFFKYFLFVYTGVHTILFYHRKVRTSSGRSYADILVNNLGTYGGGCKYSESSSINDGMIEFSFFHSKIAFYKLMANWLSPYKFAIDHESRKPPQILSFDSPVPVQVDGEDYTGFFEDCKEFEITHEGLLEVRV